MNGSSSPMRTVAYIIIGLIMLVIAAKVIGWIVTLISGLVAVAIELLILLVVVYLGYLIIKAKTKYGS